MAVETIDDQELVPQYKERCVCVLGGGGHGRLCVEALWGCKRENMGNTVGLWGMGKSYRFWQLGLGDFRPP